jgi:hypothetical protein
VSTTIPTMAVNAPRETAREIAVLAIPATALAPCMDGPVVGSRNDALQWGPVSARLRGRFARDGGDADRGEVAGGI